MKKSINEKYSYWKWVLLKKQTALVVQEQNRPIIAVYDPIKNIMFRYDIEKKQKIKTKWDGLDWLFTHCLSNFVEIGELKEFYKSLPKDKKVVFWDCLSRSMK